MTDFDLVVEAATIIDGSESATPYVADIGITGGRIADVGHLASRSRRSTLDASGRVAAPGFIDTHTHVEMASLQGSPDRFAPLKQGITTTLTGADGFGWVGLDATARRRQWDDLSFAYGAPLEPLPEWNRPEEYMRDMRAASPTQVVHMAPHGNIRAAVMGDHPGPASPAERQAMGELVRAWMDAGAVGLATGLDYLPGRYADTDEIVELCSRIVDRGGVYASHLRLQDLGWADAWREIGEIGHRTGIPIRIAHSRLNDEGTALLAEISPGNDLTFDTYLYPAGCTSIAFHVPPQHLRHGIAAFAERLKTDDTLAAEIAVHLQDKIAGQPGQRALVAATASGRHEGWSLDEIANERGGTVGEAAVELMRTELPIALLVYVWQEADDSWTTTVRRTLNDEHSIIASDGVYIGSHPHPRGFGAFARVLGTYVREANMVALPTAIHKMTGKPAQAYGLTDRGRVDPGLRADLVVFDPETVAGTDDFQRPRTEPNGVDLVLIAGQRVAGSRKDG